MCHTGLYSWTLLFNIFINDIIRSSRKFNVILYADDTQLNSNVENFGNTTDEIQSSIISELQEICKWLDLNKLCLNVKISKFMLFHMPQSSCYKFPNSSRSHGANIKRHGSAETF